MVMSPVSHDFQWAIVKATCTISVFLDLSGLNTPPPQRMSRTENSGGQEFGPLTPRSEKKRGIRKLLKM